MGRRCGLTTNTDGNDAHSWAAFGASVRGTAHSRAELPNEDAVSFRSDDDGQWAVVAVADGHGHTLAVRAEAGARLAVNIATDAALSCWLDASGSANSDDDATANLLQGVVVGAWSAAVEADLAASPLSDAELEHSGDAASIAAHPALAYGTTLLASFALGDSIVVCQIGDGDIVAITRDGRILRPLRADSRLVGTRTTSLASKSATVDFRGSHIGDAEVEVVVVATDGYVNSFSADDGFATAGRDLWKLLHQIGPRAVEAQLGGWLESTSSDGTGDDASLAILYDRTSMADGSLDSQAATARSDSQDR
jgi:hypothetical protein